MTYDYPDGCLPVNGERELMSSSMAGSRKGDPTPLVSFASRQTPAAVYRVGRPFCAPGNGQLRPSLVRPSDHRHRCLAGGRHVGVWRSVTSATEVLYRNGIQVGRTCSRII
ncbi:hypothetical protein PCANC_28730 [Puccinia coronata f. sp. avenae]|uniref:Uncharacterized protein n=1 Tax=Puccinia coronata f. sp. avenae TaxID=200324 RepID=A0A2N5TLN8_9BASI|nr:hypothetical protein PCANC_28853 [Puccinia coronata f. sp. avenae]PLW11671.1 hypothetical protein PCASD_24773 [Puccinia coronata f. sp. avenae]PLW26407.1 hypothetical protein PCANC_28730 [Puccinia coronata f. sp. avenae]PLW30536.1 hypothetical protein PCASD_22081 [Puccinia coronata f. sp. avenae]